MPVSSTGHLILTAKVLGVLQTDFIKSFEIAIQVGAICAVVSLYWKSLLVDFGIFKKVAAAFIPTGVIGLIAYKTVVKSMMGSSDVVLWALFLGGIFIVFFEYFYREPETASGKLSDISYKHAVLIGIFQSIAIIPGVSRAAATIIGGLILGLKRKTIVEFSFLLAVPTMLAATGLDLMKNAHSFSADQMTMLAIGFVTAFLTALASIKVLLRFIQHNNFTSFGVYRIVLAVVFWMIVKS